MRVFRQAEHSRLPVYHETLDDPRGMIHIRDLMSWITEQGETGEAGGLDLGKVDLKRAVASMNITRELLYVPGSMSVLDLLLKMQTTRLSPGAWWSTNMAAPTDSSRSRTWSRRWSARSPTNTTSRTSR